MRERRIETGAPLSLVRAHPGNFLLLGSPSSKSASTSQWLCRRQSKLLLQGTLGDNLDPNRNLCFPRHGHVSTSCIPVFQALFYSVTAWPLKMKDLSGSKYQVFKEQGCSRIREQGWDRDYQVDEEGSSCPLSTLPRKPL